MRRSLTWLASIILIVLATRSIVYALSPSPLAAALARESGGPALPVVAITALTLAVLVSAAIVWLAALGVAERRQLESRPVVFEPGLRPAVFVARAALLSAGAVLVFTLLESYLHWRTGLGWHGLHCLTGPVHANAAPVIGALSLVAAALGAALDHVVAWMRRTLARLAAPPRVPLLATASGLRPLLAPRAAVATAALARGPPAGS